MAKCWCHCHLVLQLHAASIAVAPFYVTSLEKVGKGLMCHYSPLWVAGNRGSTHIVCLHRGLLWYHCTNTGSGPGVELVLPLDSGLCSFVIGM